MDIGYLPFNNFVFRSPFLAFEKFIKIQSEISISEENFKNLLLDRKMQEAIFIASPSLFEELEKYLKSGSSNKKEVERFKYSIIRYLSRMSTRCTPFGIFAGCSVGTLGEHTNFLMKLEGNYLRHTRLDMNYLCALSQDISKIPEIKHHVKYFPNTSIYKMGNKFRFIEYSYINSRRIHRISAVDSSEYLEKVIQRVSNGATHKELVGILIDDEVTSEEAYEFINELIDTQFLVSQLNPSVTGDEFLHQLLNELQGISLAASPNDQMDNLICSLQRINNLLKTIDCRPIGLTVETYHQIISEVKALITKFEQRYLFQTDMFKPAEVAVLNSKFVDDIVEVIGFLNKLNPPPAINALSKFKKKFYERYEEREVPLLEALDNESGIEYKQTDGDFNPLVDDLIFPIQQGASYNSNWGMLQPVLLMKLTKTLEEKKTILELTDDDFKSIKPGWDDLPSTISVLAEVLQDEKHCREIFLKSAGGSSAANILGRFCHLNVQIKNHVLSIARKEDELNTEIIYAEIVHLPESRTGNILFRPVLRHYEIPYLAKPTVEKEYQIELSDLTISLRHGRFLLRSKRLNKEVVPRLSNAHNYSFNSMPVYQFLCDMQFQNRHSSIGFFWGAIFNEYNWLPKVKYKNVILSRARWKVEKEDVKSFFKITDDETLIQSITKWRKSRQIPNYIILADGDNELFTDMNNALSVRSLLSLIKQRSNFYIEEFLFCPKHALVKNEEGTFTNEIVFSFFKKKSNQYSFKNGDLSEADKIIN